jgi:hypothetical protein
LEAYVADRWWPVYTMIRIEANAERWSLNIEAHYVTCGIKSAQDTEVAEIVDPDRAYHIS